jgi:hypothetical protein
MDYVLKLPAAYLNCLPEQTTGLPHLTKKDVLTPPNVSRRASSVQKPLFIVLQDINLYASFRKDAAYIIRNFS